MVMPMHLERLCSEYLRRQGGEGGASPDSFFDVRGGVTGECVVEVADEPVAVLSGEGHERAAHDNELNFIDAVAKSAQLLHTASRLNVGVVSSANRSHGSRLVARVGLG